VDNHAPEIIMGRETNREILIGGYKYEEVIFGYVNCFTCSVNEH
jgi:hypothetical protein